MFSFHQLFSFRNLFVLESGAEFNWPIFNLVLASQGTIFHWWFFCIEYSGTGPRSFITRFRLFSFGIWRPFWSSISCFVLGYHISCSSNILIEVFVIEFNLTLNGRLGYFLFDSTHEIESFTIFCATTGPWFCFLRFNGFHFLHQICVSVFWSETLSLQVKKHFSGNLVLDFHSG